MGHVLWPCLSDWCKFGLSTTTPSKQHHSTSHTQNSWRFGHGPKLWLVMTIQVSLVSVDLIFSYNVWRLVTPQRAVGCPHGWYHWARISPRNKLGCKSARLGDPWASPRVPKFSPVFFEFFWIFFKFPLNFSPVSQRDPWFFPLKANVLGSTPCVSCVTGGSMVGGHSMDVGKQYKTWHFRWAVTLILHDCVMQSVNFSSSLWACVSSLSL
jgi:hypothetical protein